jgi:hypothetical protein
VRIELTAVRELIYWAPLEGRTMSSETYQSRADADEAEAANAKTENQRLRFEKSREAWQRLADHAAEFEAGKAGRLVDTDTG